MGVFWVTPAQGNTKERKRKRKRYEKTEGMRINGGETGQNEDSTMEKQDWLQSSGTEAVEYDRPLVMFRRDELSPFSWSKLK
jgi:hypothetical protein